ncbi:Ferripyoverdine receptor precursor [Achromobacter spanius]|uniref:TonB-dependent siderophore receptor n=1 Tax=Achromobacter spanius TaxID=217203 RepID=UPI000C2B6AC9|nr:TonB-dependent receptor [Achromobacter spanius]AUA57456.1 TonB-dependent siderophore receptor [Achromobacter spanius]CAB3628840.1 Ferric-pseudobactin BN7/BN8 receptor [Achromobacter spanius]SPT37503.1 Ferripyoverdine receptor precursor [Achromobacter denitrificans]VEE54826.1 Ferripyoverdine receptor precursor [Achromobacter spanius]
MPSLPSKHRHPGTLAPVACALFTALMALASTPPAWAQTADSAASARRYDVPAGPLGLALSRFAAQAGVVLSFDASLTQGKQSAGLQGEYGIASGLAAMLAGTGLEAVSQGGNNYGVRRASAQTLAPVEVLGSREPGPSEGTDSYTVGLSTTATKLPMSLRETPQSVSVMTRQRLSDQGLNTLEDAIANTPGLTFKKKGSADDNEKGLYARGMEVTNMQVDGVPTHKDFNALGLDTALYDRIEVVRGSTGLLNGAGNPAASINLVRKRPTPEFQAGVGAAVGSWDYKRTEFDLGSPLDEAGKLRGRVVGAWQEGGSFIDRVKQDSQLLYGVIEADLGERTMLTLGGEYQRKHCTACSYFGFPAAYADGTKTDFRQSFNSATDWSRQTRTRYNVFATLDHEFAPLWKGSVTVSHTGDDNDRTYGWFSSNGWADPNTGRGASLWVAKWPIPKTQNAVDASLSGAFNAFGRQHDLVVGASLSRTRGDYDMYPLWTAPGYDAKIPDIRDWSGNMPEPDWQTTGKRYYTEKQSSIYGALRLRPTDALSVVLGSRVTWWDQQASYNYNDGTSYPDNMREQGVYTPYAGLVYDLTPTLSAYASYTSIFQPQQAQNVSGGVLEPIKGNTYEIGLKSTWLDGQLNGSLALFRTRQDNYAMIDGDKLAPNGDSAYVAADGAVMRGVEAELSGELTPGWQMQLSYAYVDRRLPQGFITQVGLPRHIAKLYTTYRLPGDLSGLTVGGGVRWESGSDYSMRGPGGQQFESSQSGYALVDLMARYQFNRQWSATLNLNNIFDKKYYASTNVYSNYYGAPFSAMLGVNYKY